MLTTTQKVEWLAAKYNGVRVADLLRPLPTAATFRLQGQGAYSALYVKDSSGLWHQVKGTTAPPYVYNLTAEHLGFCVGFKPIANAVKEG